MLVQLGQATHVSAFVLLEKWVYLLAGDLC